ncbi:MAG: hypothetical protein JO321_08205 [Solirubrobacterales bacterium]|nr:hypothetical protein [Solirubrobacterales bacterium]MBV9167925.1 hypothetical protein [Solirubrobacterales bacterium]MBV9535375.1 hypothetical protein [Solirubrobacterales bacterium]
MVIFDYPAKGGIRQLRSVQDPLCLDLLRALKRRREGDDELLAYRNDRRWGTIHADDIN